MTPLVAHPVWLQELDRDGFAILPGVLDEPAIERLISSLAFVDSDDSVRRKNRQTYAVRNLLTQFPDVRGVARSRAVLELVHAVLGPAARTVRAILFDKTPGANWKVAWHQDLSIAVKQRADAPGFGPWSQKAGVPHVQPPGNLLESMLTVRLHLDDCGPDSGPLKVIPASHRFGILSPEQVEREVSEADVRDCCVGRGGAVLMRPLLLHASSSAVRAGHRRVVHLEYGASSLPPGLEWFEQV